MDKLIIDSVCLQLQAEAIRYQKHDDVRNVATVEKLNGIAKEVDSLDSMKDLVLMSQTMLRNVKVLGCMLNDEKKDMTDKAEEAKGKVKAYSRAMRIIAQTVTDTVA